MRTLLFTLALLIVAVSGGRPTVQTASAQIPVDVALVLALDSSASVDAGEFALQRDGLAAAFRDPQVIQAIENGPLKRIAVSVIEWAGEAQQQVDIGWSVIQSAGDAIAFADRIAQLNRSIPTGATSIAGALTFADAHLRAAPVEATRKVIDLSGDGRNNQGMDVRIVRRAVIANGVTVNALAILNEHPTLNYYYEDRVIGGIGAFVEIAEDYADYRDAINRKIIREIRSLSFSEATEPEGRRTLSAMILPNDGATVPVRSSTSSDGK